MQICPYWEHPGAGAPLEPLAPVVATPLLVPLVAPLLVPLAEPLLVPLVGMTPHGPHIPRVLPAGTAHEEPGQQSAVVEQVPHAFTHWALKHTSGGVAPAVGLGTQGTPPQQSALEAHA